MTTISLEWMDEHDVDAADKLREACADMGEDPADCTIESDLGKNPSGQPSYSASLAGFVLKYGHDTDWEWE